MSLWGLRRSRPALSPNLGVVPKVVLAVIVALGVALLVPASPFVLSIVAGAFYAAVAFATRAVPHELMTALQRRAY